jgi:beta-mannanase
MDRYIKLIQTRMNRRLKSRDQSVTKQQVRDVYSQVVKNPDKPTDLEMSRVTELLAGQFSSLRDASRTQEETLEAVAQDGQLTVSQNTENQESRTLEVTAEDDTDLWETLQPATEEPSESSQAQSEEVGELTIAQSSSNLATHEPEEAGGAIGITQAQIEEAVELAIAQTGESGSAEAKEIMTQLALHLSSDINTLEQAVAALVSGYLNKRSNVLKNAMGALNTLRNAQTNSFCSGFTPDFLAKQKAEKKQLMEIANIFN